MVPHEHSLRFLFHQLVDDCCVRSLGMDDTEMASYLADLLTDFSESDKIYALRDTCGRPVKDLDGMLTAADPVHGTAMSFDAERMARKHIGDYALFFTGMYPEAMHATSMAELSSQPHTFLRLVQTGKESYDIVSAFDLFEYAREAPLFKRLATEFESCIFGLNLVRQELDRRRALPPAKAQPRLM